jgi:putative transferase (TIGR04331 family)
VKRQIDADVTNPHWETFDSLERFSCTQVSLEIDEFVSDLVIELSVALNEVNQAKYSVRFWDRYIRSWLLSFVDTVFVEWLEYAVGRSSGQQMPLTKALEDVPRRASRSMNGALAISQDQRWRGQLKQDIQSFLGGSSHNFLEATHLRDAAQTSRRFRSALSRFLSIISSITGQRPIVLAANHFPWHARLALSLSFFTLPTRSFEPNVGSADYSIDSRLHISEHLKKVSDQSFGALVRALLPAYLPMSTVELFSVLVQSCGVQQRKKPRVIFSDNQHFSSESFALWIALQGERGTQLAISQHGGLNGQGLFQTRDEQIEIRIADAYLHWGWSVAPNAVRVPTLINTLTPRKLARRSRSVIMLVTDTTFRYRRKYWSDSDVYKRLVLRTFRGMPEHLKEVTTVRLHRDHDKYDESHKIFWNREFPNAKLDDGFIPMRQLLRHARLVICTTFGTTEIECFLRNIPVVLSLDPILHRPRPEFAGLVDLFESVGLIHYSEESLHNFLQEQYVSLEVWWTSDDVQRVIAKYLDQFGHRSQQPIRDYRKVLKELAKKQH